MATESSAGNGGRNNHAGEKTWIVRDQDGKIYGPFNTEQVLVQIDRGYFLGDEDVALYPGGKWVAISNTIEFYDRLLDVLSQDSRAENNSEPIKKTAKRQTQASTVHPSKPKSGPPSSSSTPQTPLVVPPEPELPQLTSSKESSPNIIELTDLKSLEELEEQSEAPRAKRLLPWILIGTGVALAGALIFGDSLFESSSSAHGRIHLIGARKNQAELPIAKIKEKYKRAITVFQSDLFSGYQQAQTELVEVVEGLPRDAEKAAATVEVYSTLCLTYRELWPYSFQDAQDMKILREAVQDAKRLDPAGIHGATCEAVQLLLAGNYRDADRLAASRLMEEGQAPVLFEMRADAYMSIRDSSTAVGYYERARLLWPAWQKITIGEARARVQTKDYVKAMNLYKNVLKHVPEHPVAMIELGLIEYRQFDKQDQALELLNSGLNGDEKVPQAVASDGWLGLAEISIKRNKKQQAIDYARKAYALNTGNVAAKDFLTRLAGEKGVKQTKVAARELVFSGDQHAKAGDCFQAQAEYKTAFDSDPKMGVAAMKAGKCLWTLNQSGEAIEWMKKAIQAEPTLSGAYVELADYYALRYDYQSAFRVLQRIQQLQPNNYEVFRGYALVELRRNNFPGAIKSGTRALALYGADLDTFLLMAKAHFGQKEYQEAQSFAQRALEIDGGNIEAQSLLGKIEAGIRGVDFGADYLQKLINQIVLTGRGNVPPAAIAYRMALAEVYLADEKLSQAEVAARQAVGLDPNNKEALIMLGQILQQSGSVRDSLEMYLKAAVLDPADVDPIFSAGNVYIEVGKYQDAISQFNRVLKVNPRYPRAHVSLARAYLKQNQFQEALNEGKLEQGLNPDLAEAYTVAAEAFYGLAQYSNCASQYQMAVRKRPQPASILVRMARCIRLSGSREAAQSILRQAQSLESGNPEIYKEQAALFHQAGKADEAIAAYDTYLRLVPNAPDKAEIENKIQKIQSGDMSIEGM